VVGAQTRIELGIEEIVLVQLDEKVCGYLDRKRPAQESVCAIRGTGAGDLTHVQHGAHAEGLAQSLLGHADEPRLICRRDGRLGQVDKGASHASNPRSGTAKFAGQGTVQNLAHGVSGCCGAGLGSSAQTSSGGTGSLPGVWAGAPGALGRRQFRQWVDAVIAGKDDGIGGRAHGRVEEREEPRQGLVEPQQLVPRFPGLRPKEMANVVVGGE